MEKIICIIMSLSGFSINKLNGPTEYHLMFVTQALVIFVCSSHFKKQDFDIQVPVFKSGIILCKSTMPAH